MTKLLLLLAVLLLALSSAHSQTGAPAKKGLTVNGVGLGATYKEVVRKLGKPVRTLGGKADECIGGKKLSLHYAGLKLELFEEGKNRFTVGSFDVTGTKWSISGVKVGASETAIRQRFGKSDTGGPDEDTGQPVWYYEIDEESGPGNSNFYFRNGKVVRISSYYLMC
jgi:hypothetical protein